MKTLAWIGRRSLLAAALPAVLALQGCQASGRGGGEPAPDNAQAAVTESTASGAGAQHARHLLLVVDHDAAGFHVRHAQIVAAPLPVSRFPQARRWRADVEDALGKTVFSTALAAGGERRGEFATADGGMQGVHFHTEEFSFVLRLPLLEQAKRVHFWEASAGEVSAAPSAAAPSAAAKVAGDVDLGEAPYPADAK